MLSPSPYNAMKTIPPRSLATMRGLVIDLKRIIAKLVMVCIERKIETGYTLYNHNTKYYKSVKRKIM